VGLSELLASGIHWRRLLLRASGADEGAGWPRGGEIRPNSQRKSDI
jgi:hypothetical protein